MRSTPSRSRSVDVAYDSLKKPGASKPSPGVMATATSFSMASASSPVVLMPVGESKSATYGNR